MIPRQICRRYFAKVTSKVVGALATGARRPLVVPMPAITKVKKAAARPTRSTVKKAVPARIPGLLPVRTPPPAKFTAADLLKMKDFGKGADWDVISVAYESRADSRR